MKPEEWNRIYQEISVDIGFSRELDYTSSLILSSILGSSSEIKLIERFRGKSAYIVGNSPNVKEYIERRPGEVSIVADSAIDAYHELLGFPDIIVTDLDGNVPLIWDANSNGTMVVIHAHGDNISKVKEWSGRFRGNRIGTTQNLGLWNVFNFYGFTDGDRAAYLADFLGSKEIRLVGFDFEKPSKKGSTDPERKLKKLRWAKILLSMLAHERGGELTPEPVILL